jgi:hypothetical protein
MADQQNASVNLNVDRSNLYREELFTDLKVCTIRKLTPVKADGTADKTRKDIFVGQTHLVSPNGPIPVQSLVKAKDLQQAFKKFPEAMKAAMEQMVAEAKKMQQQEESRIIVPGR